MAKYEGDMLGAGYTEYITTVKATGKVIAARIGIILGTALMLFVLFYFTFKTVITVAFMASVAIIFIAWFLLQFTKIEYEYVVATGHFELSKIYGARVRRKICGFDTAEITRIAPYRDGSRLENVSFACDKNDANAYAVTYHEAKGDKTLVISMPDKAKKCFMYYKRTAFAE